MEPYYFALYFVYKFPMGKSSTFDCYMEKKLYTKRKREYEGQSIKRLPNISIRTLKKTYS